MEDLLQAGVTWTDRAGGTRPVTADDVLIVAPYNAQIGALRRALGDKRIGTVDKFQGQEAPVVIYSMTSSSPEDAPRGMRFLYNPNRLNVATSRARGVVIVVASPRLFEPECHTPDQMRWANGLCRFRELATEVGDKRDPLPSLPSRCHTPHPDSRHHRQEPPRARPDRPLHPLRHRPERPPGGPPGHRLR